MNRVYGTGGTLKSGSLPADKPNFKFVTRSHIKDTELSNSIFRDMDTGDLLDLCVLIEGGVQTGGALERESAGG